MRALDEQIATFERQLATRERTQHDTEAQVAELRRRAEGARDQRAQCAEAAEEQRARLHAAERKLALLQVRAAAPVPLARPRRSAHVAAAASPQERADRTRGSHAQEAAALHTELARVERALQLLAVSLAEQQ